MSIPSYAVNFRGFPACPCLATWLPAFEAELQRRGILAGPLHIYQLIGGAAASAGTHSQGGAFDLLDLPGDEDLVVARQMGADATWSRGPAQGFTPHVHGVLTGCPHNGPAHYQIDAVKAGFNGLGHLGRGAPDDGPRPLSGRTWQQGLAWARQQRTKEDPNMALLADLDAARRKHGASRLRAARVLLRAVRDKAGPIRAARLRTALAAIKGMI
jgi:hypothetical protein